MVDPLNQAWTILESKEYTDLQNSMINQRLCSNCAPEPKWLQEEFSFTCNKYSNVTWGIQGGKVAGRYHLYYVSSLRNHCRNDITVLKKVGMSTMVHCTAR